MKRECRGADIEVMRWGRGSKKRATRFADQRIVGPTRAVAATVTSVKLWSRDGVSVRPKISKRGGGDGLGCGPGNGVVLRKVVTICETVGARYAQGNNVQRIQYEPISSLLQPQRYFTSRTGKSSNRQAASVTRTG